ncbi:oligopeptide ABC transporter substrate-binding protein [Oceanobacillus sojae]|uniref:oligopeptide ABC transporter substrate-binding protein n=1 Tax=Oceanobacillus sojae TaxID=582851 RepID=UPI0021A7109E|nr:oligopeptide ABC transporter substrate-binding protein [Oceanobacillus sojae]MCT1902223.1 oligopeptide ABC transporter substrate-binding protein [Oceanobacillus sojae]
MKKASLSKLLLAMMLMLILVLAACNSGSDDNAEGDGGSDDGTEEGTEDGEGGSEDQIYSIEDFSDTKTDAGEAIDGGTLNYGLVGSTVFEGILNWNFYQGNPDAHVIGFFDESLLSADENFTYTQDGAATFETSEDNRTFTFTIADNVNWHDGEPVTAEDWAYSYEVIGHPDYTGIRYDASFRNIEGMDEYHSGDSDTISGIEIIDDKTLEITYKEAWPSLLAGGIWAYATPKHIFEDIPIAEMEESDEVRKNPIGMGPFKVESIVPGESVTYTANEDYWKGAPKLDGVTLKVVSPETVVQALESGEIDIAAGGFPTDQYPDVEESLTNVEFLGVIDNAYTYIGFKLGHWDADNAEVVTDPDAKMADVELRRAMWHAVDNNAVGERFYKGLRWNATTLIGPAYPDFYNDEVEAPTYDPDEANRILDEAGYEDVDGDGIREDKDGEELVINFASMEGGDTAEPIANYYIQAWEAVGLKVELLDGRLHEMNAFYDRVEADDPDIDIYQGAWSTGSDVDPSGLYGKEAPFNYSRYSSEENDSLIAEGNSEESFDIAHRQEVYKEWQELMVQDIPVFPTVYRAALEPVNERVTGYSAALDWSEWQEVGVTQEEPVLPE